MSAQTRTYWDLICDEDGCGVELSAYSDMGYPDEQGAREDATGYDWTHTEDGRDLCPNHSVVATQDGADHG